jgi:colicin import membrane protein
MKTTSRISQDNANDNVSTYKTPFICALILHVVIGVALSIQLTAISRQPALQANIGIVQAFSVNQQEMETSLAKLAAARRQAAEDLLRQQRQQREQAAQMEQQQKQQEQQHEQRLHQQQQYQQRVVQQNKAEMVLKRRTFDEQMQQEMQTLNQEMVATQKKAVIAVAAKQEKQEKKILQNSLEQELAREGKLLGRQKIDAEAGVVATKMGNKSKSTTNDQNDSSSNSGKDGNGHVAAAKAGSGSFSSAQLQEIDKYKAMVLRAISQEWAVPDGVDAQDSCQLLVRVGPGGVVLSVTVVQPGANPLLERSAQKAVWKASPLPTPEDSALFESFRSIKLTVRPETITTMSGGNG